MEFTDNEGIDYGRGITNINDKGIRFGVINQNEVLQVWADESEAIYNFICPHCEIDLGDDDPDICPHCETEIDESEWDMMEPIGFMYTQDGYRAFVSDDYGDIFIEASPYYTYAQFCSPCAPGACYLMNPISKLTENNKCYCFGPDWFDGEPPYPIYKFSDDKGEN